MKNLLLLCTLISIVFLSCDYRQTKKEALERAISQFNLNNKPPKMVTYHPETYIEIVTDTIISNGMNVHIKNYSLSDEHILVSNDTDETSKNANYRRVFESKIIVSAGSKDIFSTKISAKQFKALDADPFWDNATLQHTWVNQEFSTTNYIALDISFINPKNNGYKLYRMSVDSYGQRIVSLIEDQG